MPVDPTSTGSRTDGPSTSRGSAVELRRVGAPGCVNARTYDYETAYHSHVTSRDDAWAGLAEDVGTALLRFAERLRASREATAGWDLPDSATRGGATKGKLGRSQLKVLEAVRAAGDKGMTSHEAATSTGLKDTNTPRILKTLEGRGLVAGAGEAPVVWRALEAAGAAGD